MGRLTALVIAFATAAAGPAVAAPATAGSARIDTLATPATTEAKPVRERRVFISPSGEPFRQGPDDPDPLKAWFDRVDAAHKGYFDRADFRADATRFFGRLDENGDKVIDGFEVADYEAKTAPELAEWASGEFPGEYGQARGQRQGREGGGDEGGRDRHGGEGGQEHGGAGRSGERGGRQGRDKGGEHGVYQLINEPEPVSDADFDLDSHITFDEWMRATDQRFAILDAAKDGHVTLEELRARFLPIKK